MIGVLVVTLIHKFQSAFEEDMSKFINSSWIEKKNIKLLQKFQILILLVAKDHVVEDFYSQILR